MRFYPPRLTSKWYVGNGKDGMIQNQQDGNPSSNCIFVFKFNKSTSQSPAARREHDNDIFLKFCNKISIAGIHHLRLRLPVKGMVAAFAQTLV